MKRSETDTSLWVRRIASAMRAARVRTISLGHSSRCPSWGMESVTTTSRRMLQLLMRWHAGFVSRPCVAQAITFFAPLASSISQALIRVPAVSMMSSTMIQVSPVTSPTSCMASTFPASTRRFRIVTTWATPMLSARIRARSTPPASGATTHSLVTSLCRCCRCFTNSLCACRLSTGVFPKKPWICPQCKSTEIILSNPMATIIWATAEAEMGTRACVFLSWRLYAR
mmetsp:Transcript_107555/g.185451  ORF Transcript_107555/g.185451 Transcript_107555/m.185451 type:complete len:227 (+) Transcript_107555:288-968(+)